MKAIATNPHVRHARSSFSSAAARAVRASGADADAEEDKVDVNDTKNLKRRLTIAMDEVASAHLINDCKMQAGDNDSKYGERPDIQLRIMKAAGRRGAKRWLYVLPGEDRQLQLNRWEFEQSLRLLFGAPLGQTQPDDRCTCDNNLLSSKPSDHVMCCRTLRSATNARHDSVLAALQLIARRIGLTTRWKPRFREGEHTEIPDLSICGGGIHVLVDVTFAHSSAPSAASNEVAVRAASKAGKYDLSMMRAGADQVIAFAVESHGALGKDAAGLIEQLAHLGAVEFGGSGEVSAHWFKDIIAIAIQRGHAALVIRCFIVLSVCFLGSHPAEKQI